MEPITDLRVDYLPRTGTALLRLRVTLTLLGLIEEFPLLILGAPTRTEDANRALAALATMARTDPALRAAFTELDVSTLADAIERADDFPDFRAALGGFLAEYGHRETVSPILMSAPTWGEEPATVLGLIKVLVEDPPPPPAAADRTERALRRLVEHRLVRLTRSSRSMTRLVDAARAGVAFREDSHFHFTRALPVLRRAALEIGRRLAAAVVLREAAEVVHLRLEELEGSGDPAGLSAPEIDRLRSVVRDRLARRAELAGVPLITTAVLYPAATTGGDALVSGTPASGGRATGPVCVIRDPTEFGKLHSGDILVCGYTNPAWTPLFQRAAAVVVDAGGLGSHAAIVAREYGIPAVMGSGTGTEALADGQRVTVDGDTGRVTRAG